MSLGYSITLTGIASFRGSLEIGTLPKATAIRIVQFLVKRHELGLNKGLRSLPQDHTVEHILPRNPKEGAWATWSADGKLIPIYP